jgi:hypothetical protein
MIRTLPVAQLQNRNQGLSPCEHRTVSKDGRIVCSKIVEGDNEVSPNVCRACPLRAVNCAHLRFSLRKTSATALIVRCNGRTELWNDDPPQLLFERAACAAKVMPIDQARSCAGCTLRQPLQIPAEQVAHQVRRANSTGKVVPFPEREMAAATG